jgi:NAD(P)-dependent dehydrogenase (short-subunit alcohol dehydrogenase family)
VTTTCAALVTGASRGIGHGIALRLASRGHALTVAARDQERLASVADELRAAGAPDVQPVAGDIADEGYLAELVAAHADRFGKADALVLNAGVGSAGPLADFHPRRFDKQVTVNLRAPFVLLQHAMPLLRKAAAANPQRGAKVLALTSITGVHAEPDLAVYGATKAALTSLIRSVNREEARHGVCATAISPAYVDTDMATYVHDRIPAAEMITVDDVVEVVDACLRLSARAMVAEVVIARSSTDGHRA